MIVNISIFNDVFQKNEQWSIYLERSDICSTVDRETVARWAR